MQTVITAIPILIKVTDLRPIDWQSGKRLAISAEECHICDKCTKRHAVVCEVFYDGKTYLVGTGCCKKILAGWQPTKEEFASAEKAAKVRDLLIALEKLAQPIIDQVNVTPAPELHYHSSRWTCLGYDYIWTVQGDDHLGIRVHSGKAVLPPQNEIILSDADHARWQRVWQRRQVRELVAQQGYAEKTAKKLTLAIYGLIGLEGE